MKQDTTYGPPKEMFSAKQRPRRKNYGRNQKGEFDNEFMSDDEFQLDENDDGVNMARLRKYEVNKMKYYFAFVTCSKRKVAAKILDEFNNFELELTNLRLNLSIVPDDLEAPNTPRETATEIPVGFDFNASKISRALNHSTVRLSWDQNDPKRLSKLRSNYNQLLKSKGKKQKKFDTSDEDEAYKDLIAGSSDEEYGSEGSHVSRDQTHIEEMRKKLLQGISDIGTHKRNKDLKNSDSDESLEIKFGVGFGEDIGKKLLE